MMNHKLSLPTKTLTITKAFEDAVATGEGKEYELYMRLLREIPGLIVVRKTHAKPKKYQTKTGETFKCNQFKNLTYKNMETFIKGLPNDEDYMEEYLFLKKYASAAQTNGYTLIRRWFVAQFPEFRKNPLAYIDTQPDVLSGKEFAEMAENEVEKVA